MSPVTRSLQATTPAEVRAVERRRETLPNGVWGVALLIATEATLFGLVLGSYWYLRFRARGWPPAGIEHPKVLLPLVLVAALVATSVPLLFAVRAARDGRPGAARALLVLALLVQAGYLAGQMLLFFDDLDSFSPRASAYGSVYFGMLGLHHAHVAVGILLEAGILARLARGLTAYRVTGLRAIAWYWYFVNALAVLIVLTQVSPSL
jgi:heme/copper-type cytochrome/quinol oxidase subunit 3